MNITVYKETDDHWYDSFRLTDSNGDNRGTLVGLSLTNASKNKHQDKWIVQAYGDDDYGLMIEIDGSQPAYKLFMDLCGLDRINKMNLIHLGFGNNNDD